mgnify:CR=1 FL=1
MKIEFCIESVQGAKAAQKYEASSVELCSELENDGLTPSEALITKCKSVYQGEIHIMIRPRAGDFVYSTKEIDQMKKDIGKKFNHSFKTNSDTEVLLYALIFNFKLPEVITEQLYNYATSVAVFSMIGSLIYSEVVGFIPCKFCWYQRYIMYPLAIILLIGLFNSKFMKLGYFSVIGFLIGLYHIYLQNGGGSGGSGGLTSGNAPASSTGSKRFSPVDARDDSNIIVQSIYNLVG